MKVNDPTPWGIVDHVAGCNNMTSFSVTLFGVSLEAIRLSRSAWLDLPQELRVWSKHLAVWVSPSFYESGHLYPMIPKSFNTGGDWDDFMDDSYFYMCGDEPYIPLAVYGSCAEIRRVAIKKIRESKTLPDSVKLWAFKKEESYV